MRSAYASAYSPVLLQKLIPAYGHIDRGGRIGIVGVYAGYTNHFNIGAFMEKGLKMAAGQVCSYLRKCAALLQCKSH